MALRLLADENIPKEAVDALRSAGHDVVWLTTESPGSRDRAVLERAQAEQRILLTFDKDFGELAFRAGLPSHCGIVLLRIEASGPAEASMTIVAALGSREDWAGHFSVVEPGRIRMIELPV
ncbi:MAG TPA: DUF5615 family PIN-like protein [Dehalococcoidia bacterium]|nr:DUF5615 family PIN-like protein [Dehalococcoidia bacterium]